MTTWILIVYFGYQAGAMSVEFSTRERCEAAGTAIVTLAASSNTRFYKCFEK